MNAPYLPNRQRKPSIKAVTGRLQEFIASDNVAELIDQETLADIGSKVCSEYEIDLASNEDWRRTANAALDVALQTKEVKNYPFPGASNVKYPLVTVAALQFNARAYPAIVDGQGIVKAKIVGSDDGVPKTGPDGQPMPMVGQDGQPVLDEQGQPQPDWEIEPGAKRQRADRVSRHMSYQLMDEMEEWEEDTDTLLMQLPIVGTAFRKVYFDPSLGRNKSEMAAGTDVVVHKNTRALETCPRITHRLPPIYPHEIEERQRAGLWLEDFEPGQSTALDGGSTEDDPHDFLEQHRLLDLDGDGYREPYIVTVHEDSEAVVRIVANYGVDEIKMAAAKVERIDRRDYFVKYGFIPDPKGGFYDIGFGQLLESLGAAIDTSINQMLDAGHLQNAGGGFIGSGLRFGKSTITMTPGVYKTVQSSGAKIRDAIVNFEHPGPSNVLFSLLGMMIDAAKDITAVQDILTGDTKDANQTATTTLALIEQGMKVFTAIYKRIYRSLKREFKLLFRLNSEHLDDQVYFQLLDEPEAIGKEDYQVDDYDVCPQADPRLVTDMQRLARAQLLLRFADDPFHDPIEVRRRYHQAVGQEDIDSFLKPPQPNPMEQKAVETELRTADAEATSAEATAAKDQIEAEEAGATLPAEVAQAEIGAVEAVKQLMAPANGGQNAQR